MAPMSEVTIRDATPADYEAIGRLSVEVYVGGRYIRPESPYVAELGDTAGRAAQADVLVAAEVQGKLIGSVTFCRYGSPSAELSQPGEAEFRMLAVAGDARRRGVGEALVQACLDRARGHDDHAVVLSTQPTMRAAHRIYERLGFTRLPERDWRPVPHVALLAYRLSL